MGEKPVCRSWGGEQEAQPDAAVAAAAAGGEKGQASSPSRAQAHSSPASVLLLLYTSRPNVWGGGVWSGHAVASVVTVGLNWEKSWGGGRHRGPSPAHQLWGEGRSEPHPPVGPGPTPPQHPSPTAALSLLLPSSHCHWVSPGLLLLPAHSLQRLSFSPPLGLVLPCIGPGPTPPLQVLGNPEIVHQFICSLCANLP